jgi:hypothetical protein
MFYRRWDCASDRRAEVCELSHGDAVGYEPFALLGNATPDARSRTTQARLEGRSLGRGNVLGPRVSEYGDELSLLRVDSAERHYLNDAFGQKQQPAEHRGMLPQQPVPIAWMWLERYDAKALT